MREEDIDEIDNTEDDSRINKDNTEDDSVIQENDDDMTEVVIDNNLEEECQICLENIHQDNYYILNCCQQKFCCDCLERWRDYSSYRNDSAFSCPNCRGIIQ